MASDVRDPFAAPGHDHAGCVMAALDAAEARCARAGQRLTPLRRRVLELVWRGHDPVGAYDIQMMVRGIKAFHHILFHYLFYFFQALPMDLCL